MRRLFVLTVMAMMLVVGGVAHAAWLATGSGFAVAQSGTFPADGPTPVSLSITNGSGTAGRPDAGDMVVVEFSDALKAASVCAGRTGGFTLDHASVVVRIKNDAAPNTENDLLEVSVASSGAGGNACSVFRFGTIDLGSDGFVTADSEFHGGPQNSTFTLAADRKSIEITLGTPRPQAQTDAVGDEVTATYVPAPGMTDDDDAAVTGTVSSTATQF